MYNKMKSTIISACIALACASQSFAAITSASVSPSKKNLSISSSNTISIRWTLTNSARTDSVTSSNIQYINAANNSVLGTAGTLYSQAGVGPFQYNETVAISAAQVKSWKNQGIKKIRLQRTFNDVAFGGSVSASMLLNLPTASITGARVSPMQNTAYVARDNTVYANWQVSTGSGHSTGIQSASIAIINPINGRTLSNISKRLRETGSGPFQFSEEIQLSAASIQQWTNQGIKRVLLQRRFSDIFGGGTTSASQSLVFNSGSLQSIRDGAPGSLAIKAMRLEFDTGSNRKVLDINTSTKARLTVIHTGTGILEGRWQIAEPGSSDGNPLYRTLSLVRKNLVANQRSVIQSPVLPNGRPGRYLLRFCVTSRDLVGDALPEDANCPISELELVVNTRYKAQWHHS